MSDEPYRYRGVYRIEFVPGGVTGEEAARAGMGALDSCVILGVVKPEGQYRQLMAAHDGFTGKDMSVEDLFRAWYIMAAQVMHLPDLSEDRRAIMKVVVAAGSVIPGVKPPARVAKEQYDKNAPTDSNEGTN